MPNTTGLFRKIDRGYMTSDIVNGYYKQRWVSDIQEEECEHNLTGRWKVISRNGESTLYLEIKNEESSWVTIEKEVERKFFKFLGKKKVKTYEHKWIDIPLWIPEDDFVYIEETINECLGEGD